MTRPKLLDLFCCQGGAAMGYHRAGFDVTGVDTVNQPRYPFEFHQADALEYLTAHGHEFDAVHASPPCHDHTSLKSLNSSNKTKWLLVATRTALSGLAVPWVIENVPGASQPERMILCGSEFHLSAQCRDGVRRQLRRHRQFESNTFLMGAGGCQHRGGVVGVYGNGGGGAMTRGYKATKSEAEEALGIDWMTRAGLSQAIPPVYCEFIGEQLLPVLRSGVVA